MKKLPILILLLFTVVIANAQDKHFTQFYAAPLTVNPALTGAFNGKYRLSGIYRDQWRGALEEPYQTYATSLDVKFDVELNSRYKDVVAIGLLFFSDKVNTIDFNTNQIALSAAFSKGLDYDSKQFITIGFQGGLGQRNINYEHLTFDDQFNDLNSFDRPTLENLPENNFSFSDFSVGLNYSIEVKKDLQFFAGASLHHFLSPQVSFFATVEDSEGVLLGDNKLFPKISGQFSANVPLSSQLSLVPRFLISSQGPHLRMNAGSNLRIALNDFNNNAIQVGTWVRPVTNELDDIFLDSWVIMVGFEFANVGVGVSYDLNIADLTTFRQGQNALELSVTYLGNYDNDSILCPKF